MPNTQDLDRPTRLEDAQRAAELQRIVAESLSTDDGAKTLEWRFSGEHASLHAQEHPDDEGRAILVLSIEDFRSMSKQAVADRAREAIATKA